jgi:hypothetical protein
MAVNVSGVIDDFWRSYCGAKNCGEAQARYSERRDYAVLFAVVPVFFFKNLKS